MSATLAAVNDCPLTAFPYPNAYRFHDPAAIRFTVARFIIDMQT